MFVKTIGTVLLLVFFYVQLGSSLECYSCNTPANCNSPAKITCDYDNANVTTTHLHELYQQNLTSLASTNYDCFHHKYISTALNVTYKGCVYRAISPCELTFKTNYSQLQRESCFKCSGNLCNPAGTFSSSMVTIFASIFIVTVLKFLKM